MTRKTSRTKSPMAMSLKSIACGRSGHNWLAAQKRKAMASRTAFDGLHARWPVCALVEQIGESNHRQRECAKNIVGSGRKPLRDGIPHEQHSDACQCDKSEDYGKGPMSAIDPAEHRPFSPTLHKGAIRMTSARWHGAERTFAETMEPFRPSDRIYTRTSLHLGEHCHARTGCFTH